MPNQMIALQAHAPQTDILGPAMSRNAQMINMMSQQAAAQRQAQQSQQSMDIARAKEAREAAAGARDASAAEIDLAGKQIDYYTKLAGQTMNPQGYTMLLSKLDKDVPDIAAAFRANLPPEKFDRNLLLQMVGSISDNFKATYGPLETEVVLADDGTFMVARTGGFEKPGVFEMEQFNLKPGGAAAPDAAAPPAAAPAAATPSSPEQIDAAAQAILRNEGPNSPALRALNPNDLPAAQSRASRMLLDRPEFQQMSAGPETQPDLANIVQTMMDTGVVSQADLEALRAAAGPQKDAQLAELLRANNIEIRPGEQTGGGMRSAVYRSEEGAPMMQQTQSMSDYVGTGRPARGKSPMQSPLPGSAQVPLPRVRAEAQAQRETPQEAAAKTKAVETAKIEVEREKALPAKRQVTTIIDKVRKAYRDLNTREAIPSEKRGSIANVFDYMASSSVGREAQRALGTRNSKLLTDITSSRKLLATAIKNATGMSAQEMNSNVELQLMLDALTDPTQGYEAAISTLDTLEQLYGANASNPSPRKNAAPKRTARGASVSDW